MRPALLLLIVAAVPSVLTADEAEDLFASLYGQRLTQVRATVSRTDDVALAAELLETADQATNQPKLLQLLCDAAFDLGGRDRSGYDTAIKAMHLLGEKVPDLRTTSISKALTYRQRQYTAAPRSEKATVGERLLRDLLTLAEDLTRNDRPGEALPLYRRAGSIAAQIRSPLVREIKVASELTQHQFAAAAQIQRLKQQIKDDQNKAEAVGKLVTIYITDLDRPGDARRYTFLLQDEQFKQVVPLAAKPLHLVSTDEAATLGSWYGGLARKATGVGRWITLTRAAIYYERFLDNDPTKNLARLKAEVDLKNIQTELAQLGHPQTPFARELKPRFDWTRRVVAALSFDQDTLSSVRRQEGEATVTRSRAADLTGNGNHALVYGPTWSGSGKFDGCYQFAADRQHLSLGKTVGGFNLSDFTISAWVKPTAPPPPPEPAEPAEGESEDAPAPPPNESVILGSSEQSSSPRWWWLSTRRFAWRAGSDRDDAVVKSVAFELPLDQWTHVAVVRKGGKVTAFADGKPIATTDEFHTGSLPVYSWGLMVGAAARGSGSRARWDHFHGAIDDLVIWKQALTAPDILQMHELAVAGESAAAAIAYDHQLREAKLSRTPATWPAGALLHLSFDQAPIAHFADRSGSRHHARLRGATWKKAGKRGGALYADGGYGHGLIPSTPKLNLPGEMTLSVWVNLSRWDEGGGICAKGKSYNEAWALDVQEEGQLRFFRRTPDAKTYQKVISSQPLTRDKWHHILAVADDRMLRIYVDGQITRGEKHGGKFLKNDEPVSIGARYDRKGRAGMNVRGLIDELVIWDRVLTSTEMKQIYEAGAGSGN